ncbi:hydroxyisourate hydrolase [Streptomyces sp. NPDC007088]|uniref:hydroxyisourate hydrolase n=1 Tax=Streptomyces sp. NPDC007088 TaxID=3364773 RepID=UPI0036CF59D4
MTSGHHPGRRTRPSVSTHVLDTSLGRPATAVPVTVHARPGPAAAWTEIGASRTDADGRCKDLPELPPDTAQVRLVFDTAGHLRATASTAPAPDGTRQDSSGEGGEAAVFFPEVSLVFTVSPGEHYHVPLLLSPFGYSAYRGS